MMTQNSDKKREQIQMFCMDDLVPENHLLRVIDKAIDWTFIYDLVEDKYSPDFGRPSMDPVMLIKIPFIQYLYVYDEYYDCYICPNNKVLEYSTTNREGYREYKSCGIICENCPHLSQCTASKEHVKVGRQTYLGAIYGEGRRYPLHTWDERTLSTKEADDRENLWNSKRESWIPIYTTIRKSPDGNESRADLRMHESEKAGKDPGTEGASSH